MDKSKEGEINGEHKKDKAEDSIAKKPDPKPQEKSNLPPIVFDDNYVPTVEDLDKYVKVFIASLVLAKTEKQVREFWKSEAKNRAMMSIQQNEAEYNLMAEVIFSFLCDYPYFFSRSKYIS